MASRGQDGTPELDRDTKQYLIRIRRVIKGTYCEERAKRSANGRYSPHPRWDKMKIWNKITLLVTEKQFDPISYIKCQFESPVRFPDPNMLLSDNAIKRYQDQCLHGKKWAEILLRSQTKACQGRMRLGYELRELLEDPQRKFTPLFRVCMAASAGLDDIVSTYFEGALEQLMINPHNAGVYKNWIPEELWNRYLSVRQSLAQSC